MWLYFSIVMVVELFWDLPSCQWEGTDTSPQQGCCWFMQTQLSQWLIIQCRTPIRCACGRLHFGSEKKHPRTFLSTLMKKMALPLSAIINTCCWAAAFGNHFPGYVYQYRLFLKECSNYIFLALPLISAFIINWSEKFLAKHCLLEYLCIQIIKKEKEIKSNLYFVSWTVNLTWNDN